MKFRIRYTEQIVGGFILLALATLALILVLMGINQRWFAKDYSFYSRFESGEGLKPGMDITLKGFSVGAVDRVELDDDNAVTIRFHIFDTYYAKVKKNSVLELYISPIGLGSGLVLHPGRTIAGSPADLVIPENSFIPSTDFEEGRKLMEAGLVEVPASEDPVTKILGSVESVLGNLDSALSSINVFMASLRSGIEGTGEGSLSGFFAKTESFATTLDSTMDTVSNRLERILTDLTSVTTNLKSTSVEFADPTGLITKLLDPKGSFARLLDDNELLFGNIDQILSDIKETAGQIREFSEFVNDTSPKINVLLEDGREAVKKAKNVLEGISNNPLIRGGITKEREQPSAFQGQRDDDF